jgi:hypothetical protein
MSRGGLFTREDIPDCMGVCIRHKECCLRVQSNNTIGLLAWMRRHSPVKCAAPIRQRDYQMLMEDVAKSESYVQTGDHGTSFAERAVHGMLGDMLGAPRVGNSP